MLASSLPLQILGTGAYLPRRILQSSELDARWGRPPGTTAREVGVTQRHVGSPDETSSFMAAAAAQQALADARLQPHDLDLIVSACAVMEQAIPCLGAQVQRALGLGASGIPAFDINATCLSFVAALDAVASLLATGRYRRVLVVSSELPSAGLNPDDPLTAALFGDGAAAAVVQRTPEGEHSALLASHFVTYGEGAELCQIRGGGTRAHADRHHPDLRRASWFEMDGRATYRLAARHFPAFLDTLLQRAHTPLDALACVVPHQASGKALQHLSRALRVPDERLVHTLAHLGNQVAASIPTALHHAMRQGRARRGDHIALLGTGAGLSLGGMVLRL